MNKSNGDIAVGTGVRLRAVISIGWQISFVFCTINVMQNEMFISIDGPACTGEQVLWGLSFPCDWCLKQDIVIEIYAIALNRRTRPFVLFSLYPRQCLADCFSCIQPGLIHLSLSIEIKVGIQSNYGLARGLNDCQQGRSQPWMNTNQVSCFKRVYSLIL